MKRTISKFIALTVTAIMTLSVAVPTLPSSFASTTEESTVIESTIEISTEEAIVTETIIKSDMSEVTTEENVEVTTEGTTETSTETITTEESTVEGSTEVITEVSTEATTEEATTTEESTTEATSTEELIEEPEFPGLSEEMLYELLFDEEWVAELTDEDIKELYGFDSREEFEVYVEMIVGSKVELEIPEELAWINNYDDDTFYMWMWMSKEEYIEFYKSGDRFPDIESPYANISTFAMSNSDWSSLKSYIENNMLGAPYISDDLTDYDNTKATGWSCAGAINHLLYYKLGQQNLVASYEYKSIVPYVYQALKDSSDYDMTYYNISCFNNLDTAAVTSLVASNAKPGDIIVFINQYAASDFRGHSLCPDVNYSKPHMAIAAESGSIYSALYSPDNFSLTTAGYYVGNAGNKAATGMAIFSPKAKEGSIRVCKSAADGTVILENPMDNPNYSMAGATYAISASNAVDANGFLANQLGTVEIEDDADNVSGSLTVPAGTYYVQEIIAPTSGTYELNKKVYGPFTVVAGKRLNVGVPSVTISGDNETFNTTPIVDYRETVDVYLKKVSTTPDTTNGNPNYSTKGTVYYLYKGTATTGTPYKILTVGDNDVSNTVEVEFGLYTAVEQTAGPGYKLDKTPITVDLRVTNADGTINTDKVNTLKGTTQVINAEDAPITGSVQVLKVLDNEELAGNDCYDKAATYVIRNAQGAQVGTLNTDAVTGLSNVVSGLPLGNYTVVETVASKGCELDTTVHNVTLTAANSSEPSKVSVQVKSVEPTKNDPVVIEIYKVEERVDEDGNPVYDENGNIIYDKVSGAASLAGAEFTITYYDSIFYTEAEIPAQHERQWVVATQYNSETDSYVCRLEDKYLVSGSELYKDEFGVAYLPLGTITIQETKTPEGYLVDGIFKDEKGNEIPNGLYITQIETDDEDIPAVVGGHKYSISNTVKRGDLAFTKVDYETLEPMAGIPFRITSETTGESHIYITNEEGVLSTASSVVKHGEKTNINDSITPDANGNYSGLTYCGAWFSGSKDGNLDELNEDDGALPFDTYKIEELRCEANKDKQLIIDTEIIISEDGVVVDDGTYTNVPAPSISTMEKDAETGTHISVADGDVTIIDTVSYKYLKAGGTYTLWGVIVNKEDGTPLKNTDGKYIVNHKVFTLDDNFEKSEFEKCGSEDMEFKFDGSTFDGYDFVVFEYLFEGDASDLVIVDENGNINVEGAYIKHADINDINQTGSFPPPTGHTIAVDAENGTHIGTPSEKATIVDTVYYEGLVPGYKYELRGKVWTKDENGEAIPFLDNGKEVTAEIEFTPTESKGSISLTFTFNASALEGKILTVFEDMYRAGRKVWTHSDIEDSWQSVSYPSIKTLATDKTNSKQLMPYIETEIIDTITFENLVPGETVIVEGIIMTLNENGNEVVALDKNGNKITATKEVVVTEKNGIIEIPFKINTGDFINKTLVVYEKIYTKDTHTLVAQHCEINSKEQSVYITDQPKTGDNTPLMVMFGIAGISLVGIIFMLISRRKRVR